MFRKKNTSKNAAITSFFSKAPQPAADKNVVRERSVASIPSSTFSSTQQPAKVAKRTLTASSTSSATRGASALVRAGRSASLLGSGLKVARSTPSWMSQSQNAFNDYDDLEDLEDLFTDEADAQFFSSNTNSIKLKAKQPTNSPQRSASGIEITKVTSTEGVEITKVQERKIVFPENKNQDLRTRTLPWEVSKTETVKISGVDLSKRLHSMTSRQTTPNYTDGFAKRKMVQSKFGDKGIKLSAEQQGVIDLALKGKSLFFTGAAGTGKSVLLRELIKRLSSQYPIDSVAVTASTGLAALNIGGETLHRFAGIGLGDQKAELLVQRVMRNQEASKRWKRCRILIIDEISMVDGSLLDKLSIIAQRLRNNKIPFGGMQLICTGDFFQLPPVDGKNSFGGRTNRVMFAFESNVWNEIMSTTVLLTEVFRQQGDNRLIEILNAMRLGELTPSMCGELSNLSRTVKYNDGIEPTELYPTRREVEFANKKRLESLKGCYHSYKSKDIVHEKALAATRMRKEDAIRMLDNNTMGMPQVLLRHDCQVMLLRNQDNGLVNGSLGIVVAFLTKHEFEIMMLNADDLNEKDADELARNTERHREGSGRYQPETLSSTGTISHQCGDDMLFPVVRFSNLSRLQQVSTTTFEITNSHREVVAERIQLPLILSWAMSVHKSQGQTLERVKVNLQKTFETGQAYVAVSRATSADRLQVINFNPSKVSAHQKVIKFYRTLTNLTVTKQTGNAQRRQQPTQQELAAWEEERRFGEMYVEDDDERFF
ncbi:hypothetical protein DV451_001302 [Geotrichum candidum]|uniref:ATP-dependent DNA helicase PIF1 n=1 Tax=Geotrichum candidum TaxID=1173061 RepID=A0A9P5KVV0_GEOCN|nr:hypothetical protein DV451_001302 [Geotrichum candidum]